MVNEFERMRLGNILRGHVKPEHRDIIYPIVVEDERTQVGMILVDLRDDDQRAFYDSIREEYKYESK